MLHDKKIEMRRNKRYIYIIYIYSHKTIRRKYSRQSVVSITGHVIIAGIYNYLVPQPMPFPCVPSKPGSWSWFSAWSS